MSAQAPSTRKRNTRKRTPETITQPKGYLEEAEWEDGYVIGYELEYNHPLFGLSKRDIVWCVNNADPKPGELILWSDMETASVNIGRFQEWSWVRILVTGADDEMYYVRPLTMALVKYIDRH